MPVSPDHIWASLGQNGMDHITSSDGRTTPSGSNKWLFLIPANGTSPTITTQNGGSGNTTVSQGDQFVDGESVPSEGLYGPFTEVELSAGEVYAYRA